MVKFLNRLVIISALILAISLSAEAHAAGSAESLLDNCLGSQLASAYCDGYIAGFYDGRTTNDYGKLELRSCPPTDASGLELQITYSQMRRVFIKWAEENSDKLHYADWQAVRQAFADAWPCK